MEAEKGDGRGRLLTFPSHGCQSGLRKAPLQGAHQPQGKRKGPKHVMGTG